MEDAQGPRNNGLFYHETCVKIYSAIKKLGFNVDVVTMDSDLSSYQLVAAPMIYLYRSHIHEKLKRFVRDGGQLVVTYWSGIVDEEDQCFLGGVPHGMMEVLGLRSTEIDGLYDGDCNYMVSLPGIGEEKRFECRNLCDLVSLSGAVPLLIYEKDFYKGYPALTKNSYGKGWAYYICADAGQDFYDDFFRNLTIDAGIKPLLEGWLPEELEISSRESKQYEYLFVQNYSREPVLLGEKTISCMGEGTLLLGKISENGEIDGYGTVVIRKAFRKW